MRNEAHRIAVRVYYEDTDVSGRVYHASYLRFLERGRTEWLRDQGLHHATLARTQQIAFAVTKLLIEFDAPALMDDLLEVETCLRELRGPVLSFEQRVLRGETKLARAVVDVVTIRGDRAVRPPREILEVARQLRIRPPT